MEHTFKPWEQLTIADDFMFAKVMQNEIICRQTLELLLDIKIQKIVYLEQQKTINMDYDAKGVRLDVYVADSDRVFDVEIQTTIKPELAKRVRYYQSMLDIDTIKKGELYTELKESFIIFICTGDPFKNKLSRYTFKNRCEELPELYLDDKTTKVFYNVNECEKEANLEVRAFLKLVKGDKASSCLTKRIQELVEQTKNHNEKWRAEYMTLDMIKKEERMLGAHNKAIETARNSLNIGLSLEQVSLITGLTVKEIAQIKTTYKTCQNQ